MSSDTSKADEAEDTDEISFKEEWKKAKRDIEKLRKANTELEIKLSRSQRKSLTAMDQTLKIADLERKLIEKDETIKERDSRVTEFMKQVDYFRRERGKIEQATAEINSLQKANSDLKQQLANSVAQLTEREEKLVQADNYVIEIISRQKEMEMEYNSSQLVLHDLQKQIQVLKADIDEKDVRINNQREKLNETRVTEERIETLNSSLKKKEAEVNNMRMQLKKQIEISLEEKLALQRNLLTEKGKVKKDYEQIIADKDRIICDKNCEIETLRVSLNQQKSTIATINETMQTQQLHQDINQRLAYLTNYYNQSEQTLQFMKSRLAASEIEINTQSQQILALNQQIKEKNDLVQEMSSKYASVKRDNDFLNVKLKQLKSTLHSRDTKYSKVKEDLVDAGKKIGVLRELSAKLEKDAQLEKNKREEAERKLNSESAKERRLRIDKMLAEKERTQAETEKEKSCNKCVKTKKEYRLKVDNKNQIIEKLESKLKEKEERVEILEVRLRDKDRTTKNLEEQVIESEEKRLELYNLRYSPSRDYSQDMIGVQNDLLKKRNDQIKELKATKDELLGEVKDLKQEVKKQESQIEKLKIDVASQSSRRDSVSEAEGYRKLKVELDGKCSVISELEKQISKRDAKIGDLQKEVHELKLKGLSSASPCPSFFQELLGAQGSLLKKRKEDVDQLNKTVDERDVKISRLKEELKVKSNEGESSKKEIEALNKRIEVFEQRHVLLGGQSLDVELQLELMKSKNESLSLENSELKAKVEIYENGECPNCHKELVEISDDEL